MKDLRAVAKRLERLHNPILSSMRGLQEASNLKEVQKRVESTGESPSKRTYEMICFYLIGWASLEELEAHIKKLSDRRA